MSNGHAYDIIEKDSYQMPFLSVFNQKYKNICMYMRA